MSKRKDKIFSVSMRSTELDDVEVHLDKLEESTGYKVYRNELIRKATLAHIKYMELKDTPEEKSYFEIFKGIKK